MSNKSWTLFLFFYKYISHLCKWLFEPLHEKLRHKTLVKNAKNSLQGVLAVHDFTNLYNFVGLLVDLKTPKSELIELYVSLETKA